VPPGSEQLRVVFEVPGLSEAVALASELRVVAHGGVRTRPASRRPLDRRWRVTLTIPARPHTIAQVRTEVHELVSRHTGCRLVDADAGPLRVLIVDDSPPFRRAARDLLLRRGYVVVGEVGSAAAARDAVELLALHALLIDVGLPDGCGFELATALIRSQPNLAVLLMSANDPPEREQRLNASGARGFVLKSSLASTPLERFWRAPSP
jgi:two-component system, chemotaxis family, chemotaxis protein CheY